MFEDLESLRAPVGHPMLAIIEPWEMEVVVPPGSLLELHAFSRTKGSFEREEELDHKATFWARPGTTVKVYLDGELVSDHDEFPDLPPSMDVQRFLVMISIPSTRKDDGH